LWDGLVYAARYGDRQALSSTRGTDGIGRGCRRLASRFALRDDITQTQVGAGSSSRMIRARWPDAYRDDVAWARVLAGRGFDLLVVGLAVVSEIEIWVSDVPGPTWVLAPGVLLYTLPLLFRRRFPFLAPVFVFGVHIAISFTDPHAAGSLDTGSVALLLAFWAMGAGNDGQLAIAGLGIGFGTLAIIAAEDDRVDVALALNSGIVYGLAWLFALLLARRNRRALAAEKRATQLERDQHERARAAVADERARIAREMHDVIAHSVSVMTVQAGAARMQLPEHPEQAMPALLAVEETGRQALAEMRRLLGILRQDDAPALAPQPGLADLPTLAEAVRHAGLPVEVNVEGSPRPLPAGVDLTAYRIVQEALTNTLKHASPTRATVVVHYERDAVVLDISDDGRVPPSPDGAGHGLTGMRERVSIYGGELRAGPGPNGGFAVSARLPVETVPR
jgi:signal transduction histidine kinase